MKQSRRRHVTMKGWGYDRRLEKLEKASAKVKPFLQREGKRIGQMGEEVKSNVTTLKARRGVFKFCQLRPLV